MEIIQLKAKEAISKADITSVASDLLDKLINGEISALALKQKFCAIGKIEDAIKSKLTEIAVLEASTHPKGQCSLYGAEFKTAEFGTKYIFDDCGDPVYKRLLEESKAATKALKDREDFLKTIKGHETICDEVTGEILTIYPPIKTSQTGVSCSIK